MQLESVSKNPSDFDLKTSSNRECTKSYSELFQWLITFTIKNMLLTSIPKFLALTSYHFLSSPVHNKRKFFCLSE